MTTAVRPMARLHVLDRVGGSPIATFEDEDQRALSGSVTFDVQRAVRRRGTVALANHDGALTPSAPGDLFYTGAVFRIERGERDGEVEPLVTLVVASFDTDMEGRLDLTGEGVLSLLAQPFGDAAVIAAATGPEDALRALWAPVLDPAGDGADWVLDGGGRLMPLRAFLPDEDRLDAVLRYFAASGLEVYEDRLGRPTMRPMVDPALATTSAVVREFRPGVEAVVLSMRRSGGRRAYNRVIVESSNPAGPDVRVVLDVSDPASPIHRDRIGLRTAPIYRSAQVPDLGAAGALARQLLNEYALATDTTSGTAVPDHLLDAGDVVWIEEPRSGTDGRYRLNTLTLPVLTGSMSLTAGRLVPLLLTGDAS